MGQGTESCGGYDPQYDPYDENLGSGNWIQKNGQEINVQNMANSHLKNTIRLCRREVLCAIDEYDQDKWNAWISLMQDELFSRERTGKVIKNKPRKTERKTRKPPRNLNISKATLQMMLCHCGNEYKAKTADLKRGWGLSCSKSCAAIRRKYNKKPAKAV